MSDRNEAARILAEAARSAIANALAPVLNRIETIEAKLAGPVPRSVVSAVINRENVLILTMSDGATQELGVVVGRDGSDADMASVAVTIREEVAKAVAPLLEKQGTEQAEPVTEAFIAPIVERAVERAIGALPRPKDGKSVDRAEISAMVEEAVAIGVSSIPKPADGKSVTLEEVRPVIETAVKEAVAALPPAKDGADADQEAILVRVLDEAKQAIAGIDLAPLVKAAVETAVAAIQPAKDGVGLAGAMIDRGGNLVVTLTNGETRNLGIVVGADADMEEIKSIIIDAVGKIPAPKDGKDGINWDDLTIEQEGVRTVKFRYQRGERSQEFTVRFPAVIYRGVFNAGEDYAQGDLATWDGSLWHCNVDRTKARPGAGTADWTLAAKRGRDGKGIDDKPTRITDPRIKS